jgi:hypothetical protein
MKIDQDQFLRARQEYDNQVSIYDRSMCSLWRVGEFIFRCPFRVKRRNTLAEHMFSGLPLIADIGSGM